jgi:hypothetical protein
MFGRELIAKNNADGKAVHEIGLMNAPRVRDLDRLA